MPRILIIDDDSDVRKALRKMLEKEGYAVDEATDGGKGLIAYISEPADLVITDMIMPETEGIETIRELKRHNANVKIIAISGGGRNSPEGYLEMAEAFGVNRTFMKPIFKNKLMRAVRDLLS